MTQGQGGGVPPTMMMQGFNVPPGTPPPQQPFGPAPAPAPPPPAKKSTWYYYVGAGCGCLALSMLSCCGIGGYLFYLEEGRPYNWPGDELASIPVQPGVPFTITATWDGGGSADMRAYLELPGAQSGDQVTGRFGCESSYSYSGEIYTEPVSSSYFTPYGGHPPEGWIEVMMYHYRRGSSTPFRCEGTLDFPPRPGARLVLTVRQRPSDWLD